MPGKMVDVFTPEEIAIRTKKLGQEISNDYQKILTPNEQILMVGVLNGAFIFMADLIRQITVPVEVDFVRLSSYQDQAVSTSKVLMTKGLEKDVGQRHVLVVEDIADCGMTLAWLLDFISKRNPASIRVAVAIDKKVRREIDLTLDYTAFAIDDGFLVGYGLDYAGRYRQLQGIHHLLETN